MLEGKGVTKRFGGLTAVDNVDFKLTKGEITGLIGPNGSGKTTLFNCITSFYPIDSGRIEFKGERIDKLLPFKICKKGISRTFQIPRYFGNLTVLQNVQVSMQNRRIPVENSVEESTKLLSFAGLSSKKDYLAKNLTLPDLKRLDATRALASDPEVLLLDEPLAGLNQVEVGEATKFITEINGRGVTIFMVEHVLEGLMNIANRIIALNKGQKIAEGPPKEVSSAQSVIEAYLGEKYARKYGHVGSK